MFQRFSSPPTIFVTVTHGVTNRTQDAMALWVEDLKADLIPNGNAVSMLLTERS